MRVPRLAAGGAHVAYHAVSDAAVDGRLDRRLERWVGVHDGRRWRLALVVEALLMRELLAVVEHKRIARRGTHWLSADAARSAFLCLLQRRRFRVHRREHPAQGGGLSACRLVDESA